VIYRLSYPTALLLGALVPIDAVFKTTRKTTETLGMPADINASAPKPAGGRTRHIFRRV
jgi:hypothetical protein